MKNRRLEHARGKVLGGSSSINGMIYIRGNAADLADVGVDVVHDLPGVGENLQDHLEVYVQYVCKQKVSMYPALKWYNKPMIGLQWLFQRKGAAASNHFEAGGFIRGACRGQRLPGSRGADGFRCQRLHKN